MFFHGIGSTATFAACGIAALLCLPFVRGGASNNKGITTAAVAFVAFAGLAGAPTCQFESGLSCLYVDDRGSEVRLVSDGTLQASERKAASGPDDGTVGLALSYTEWIWARMDRDLGPAPSVLFIGGGGYTLPTKLLAARPNATAVAVEIDPLVTEVVETHLPHAGAMIESTGYDMTGDMPGGAPDTEGRLGIVHADGRVFLNETAQRFDAVVMDAFSSGSVPAHLVTIETFARLRDIIDGPVYVNLIDAHDGPLARGVNAILHDLFPHVVAAEGETNSDDRANILFVASNTPVDPLDGFPEGYAVAQMSDARAFTDDRGWVGHR